MTELPFFHKSAIVEPGARVGDRTRVWAFAHILPGAVIGDDCSIYDGVFVDSGVLIGNRVTLKGGVHVLDGVTLEDDVYVDSNAVLASGLFSGGKHEQDKILRTIVSKGSCIGANATVLPGIRIGAHALVEPGAVVTRDVPSYAIVAGNPASIHSYKSSETGKSIQSRVNIAGEEVLPVSKTKLMRLPEFEDMRGSLTFGEYDKHLPFIPKRYFVIFEVPSSEIRGEHAHREQHQFLVCLKGSCAIVLDDGSNRDEVVLNQPTLGLYIHPMIWATEYKFTRDAILLVLASDIYDEKDYIRDYDLYKKLLRARNKD